MQVTGAEAGATLALADDQDLVDELHRAPDAAMAEAFRRHGSAVYGLARRLVSDVAVAEEIVQEVFLRLWRQPARYDRTRGSLRSYLLTMCHGHAFDVMRSASARRERELREERRAIRQSDDVEAEVVDLVLAEELEVAIARLPEEQRRVIELAFFTGHTYREVAVLLGHAEGTVKTRIRKGLLRLRRDLELGGHVSAS
jgi:RNA polymerase sigma-70 factor, ECF subfamily